MPQIMACHGEDKEQICGWLPGWFFQMKIAISQTNAAESSGLLLNGAGVGRGVGGPFQNILGIYNLNDY